MKKIDNAAIIFFSILGIVALGGVLFAKAYWHLGTAAMCAVMVLVSVFDNKREKNERKNGK